MGTLNTPDNKEIASFLVTKLSNWRGKYKRILSVGTRALTTYNNGSLEVAFSLFLSFFSLSLSPVSCPLMLIFCLSVVGSR